VPTDVQTLSTINGPLGDYAYGGDKIIYITGRKMTTYNSAGRKLKDVQHAGCPPVEGETPANPRGFVYDASVNRVFALCQKAQNAGIFKLIAFNPDNGLRERSRERDIRADSGLFGGSVISGSKAFHQRTHMLNILVRTSLPDNRDGVKVLRINVLDGSSRHVSSGFITDQSTPGASLISGAPCAMSNVGLYCAIGTTLYSVDTEDASTKSVAPLGDHGAYYYGLTIAPDAARAYVSVGTRAFGSTTMTPTLWMIVDLNTRIPMPFPNTAGSYSLLAYLD